MLGKRLQPLMLIVGFALVGFALPGPAYAEYYFGQLEDVPIDRLIRNLERRREQNPDDARVDYLLARVHSMAFAVGQTQFRIHPDTGDPSFDDGASGVYIPSSSVNEPGDEDEARRRAAHLERAIALFQRALERDHDDMASQVGLGWSLMKAGRKAEALRILRPAFETAWESENDAEGGEWGRSLTVELGSYLLTLLDPLDDAAEIDRVRRRIKVIESKPRWITPILVPIGIKDSFPELIVCTPSVRFDLDGTGADRRWQWITPDAAWLVFDPGQRGEIRSGRDLVGARTFWVFWSDGYEALAALDDNADGVLNGAELHALALWRDLNGDGVSDPGEVRPLTHWGIVELQCTGSRIDAHLGMNAQGARFADGTTRPTWDWSPLSVPAGGVDFQSREHQAEAALELTPSS